MSTTAVLAPKLLTVFLAFAIAQRLVFILGGIVTAAIGGAVLPSTWALVHHLDDR